jgi:DNA-binding Lrp family transcriptional regulator
VAAQSVRPRDLEVVAALDALTVELGYPPTVRELASRLGYKAPQSVQRRLDRLVAAGLVRRPIARRLRALATPRPRGDAAAVVRLVPVVDLDLIPVGVAPLADADLARPEERVVAVRVARGVVGGPGRGDLAYCVFGRSPCPGDVVATFAPTRPVVIRRATAGVAAREAHVAVVVGWTHRVVRQG